MNFQMLYAGTGSVSLKGNSQASGLLYAPLASSSFAGQSDWYGAVIGASLTDMGGAAVHYDRRLGGTAYTISNYMLDSFTWRNTKTSHDFYERPSRTCLIACPIALIVSLIRIV